MSQVQVDYALLVEVMTEKLSAQLSQIVALEARIRAYDKALSEALNNASAEALNNASETKKPSPRKKSVNTDRDGGTF